MDLVRISLTFLPSRMPRSASERPTTMEDELGQTYGWKEVKGVGLGLGLGLGSGSGVRVRVRIRVGVRVRVRVGFRVKVGVGESLHAWRGPLGSPRGDN